MTSEPKLEKCPFCEVEPEMQKGLYGFEVRCKYHTQWIQLKRWQDTRTQGDKDGS